MEVCAIVAEYNPFHSGHAWQIEQTRRAGVPYIVAIMSGNFVQRGEPAVMDKFSRTRAALLCGADLVVELPLPYAVSGAQRFARGAVGVAAALGVVDGLSFGSECGELDRLLETAEALGDIRLPDEIRRQCAGGVTFARARQAAVRVLAGERAALPLSSPNDTLALEYLLAIQALGVQMDLLCIPRTGAGHGTSVPEKGAATASAGALRRLIRENGLDAIAPYVPPNAMQSYAGAVLADPARLESILLSRLRAMNRADYAALPELSEGLENRLYGAVRSAVTLEGLYDAVKTKRYTHARVRRLALAALLGLRDEWTCLPPPYVRVLGFTRRGEVLLRQAKGRALVPVSTSLARLQAQGGTASLFAQLEGAAGDQWALLQNPLAPCGADYRARVVTV